MNKIIFCSRDKKLFRCSLPFVFSIPYLSWVLTLDFANIPNGYLITVFLPVVYVVVFSILLWNPLITKPSPFVFTYCVVQAMRFIVLSISTLDSLSKGGNRYLFGYNSYSNQLLTLSAVLMVYELIATALVINITSRKKRIYNSTEIILSYNSMVYWFCIFASVGLFFFIPASRSDITFLFDFNRSQTGDLPVYVLLAREFIVTSKYFLFFIFIKFFFQRIGSEEKKNDFAFIVLLFVCVIVIGTRIGTNRKRIIADAVACMVIILVLFPRYKKVIVASFGIVGLCFVVVTSIFRGATDSLGSFFDSFFDAQFLQAYLCGQYNISCALLTGIIFGEEINLVTFVFTELRSFFGIGTMLSGLGINSLNFYFNQVSSIGYDYLRESQIIPMIGEGAIYFSPVLAPLLSVLFVYVGVLFDRLYLKSKHLEMKFISIVLAVYLGQALSLASNILVNNITFKLAIFLPVVILANKISRTQPLRVMR